MAHEARLSGHKAEFYLDGLLIAQTDSATPKFSPQFAVGLGWAKNYTTRDPVGSDWSVSASGFVTSAAFWEFLRLSAMTPQAVSPLTCKLYQMVGGTIRLVVEGPVWAGESSGTLPDAELSKQEIEFVGADAPTYVAGSSILP
jgi:hypothetical protein